MSVVKSSSIMKSRLILAASLFLAAVLTGCSTADKLNSIQIGMTKDQVIAILGKPDSMSAQADVEYLTYYLTPDTEQRLDQPYMIRLVDGKVESFGRFAQLFDLYNRPVTNARPGDPNFPVGAGFGTTTVMAPAPAAPSGTDIVSQLQKLKALKDAGVLTEEEFQKAKEKVLSDQK
jgi:Short C-terminal domain/SmpA / OmlA family